MSQYVLAERIGVSRNCIYKLERHAYIPKLETVLDIIAALGFSEDERRVFFNKYLDAYYRDNELRKIQEKIGKRFMTDIYDLLYRLGVTANYTGFFHTAYAVSLCTEQPDKLLLVTKWLYPEVAKQYRTNWKAVERNIRTVSDIIWRENRPFLEQLARRPLEQKPRSAQLLAILASSLDTRPLPVHGLSEAVALPGEDNDVVALQQENGAPIKAQHSGLDGERRSKGANAAFAAGGSGDERTL